jgi:hypothetical protein
VTEVESIVVDSGDSNWTSVEIGGSLVARSVPRTLNIGEHQWTVAYDNDLLWTEADSTR